MMGKGFRLAVGTIAWGFLRSVEDFRRVARFLAEVGVEGVGIEYRLLPRELRRRPEALARILGEAGLENIGSYSNLKEPSIEWGVGSGAKIYWVVSRERDCAKADMVLEEYVLRARSSGITVALHNHLRTCYDDLEDLSRILAKTRDLALCLDTAHAIAANIDLEEVLKLYRDRIALVHLKDLRARVSKSSVRFKRDFVNVGEGIIDFKSFLRMLDLYGYRGYLMLEIEALGSMDPYSAVRLGVERVRKVLEDL
ncbi:hypothetical protein ATG_14840 [Desulfurococcaceae archaeon AG1]|jgi:sugar phosphate isomerase/epimerase|nr:hypothetical protein ATG_14840 [Desulfurococcaceae archaeon AG1]